MESSGFQQGRCRTSSSSRAIAARVQLLSCFFFHHEQIQFQAMHFFEGTCQGNHQGGDSTVIVQLVEMRIQRARESRQIGLGQFVWLVLVVFFEDFWAPLLISLRNSKKYQKTAYTSQYEFFFTDKRQIFSLPLRDIPLQIDT